MNQSKHQEAPDRIRGARVHNLKNINVDVPLHRIVGIARRVLPAGFSDRKKHLHRKYDVIGLRKTQTEWRNY